jgi:hypothetical protein
MPIADLRPASEAAPQTEQLFWLADRSSKLLTDSISNSRRHLLIVLDQLTVFASLSSYAIPNLVSRIVARP